MHEQPTTDRRLSVAVPPLLEKPIIGLESSERIEADVTMRLPIISREDIRSHAEELLRSRARAVVA